jgi:Rieske Fe-S protein
MKKRIRYPMLAAAIAAAFGSAGLAAAKPNIQLPAPQLPRPAAATPHLSEAQKIQALIHSVETLQGAVFIRNGSEYDAAKAADHLRRKLDYAGDKVKTADQFIDKLATGSSMTGKAYQIRFADGRTIDSAVYFREQLRKLEAPPALSKKG